jgi:hypothetical protein
MALAETTLSLAKGANQTFLTIATTTGMTRGKMFQIDNELFKASSDASGTSVPVLCGQDGTTQVAHISGAQVFWGDPSDFPSAPAGEEVQIPFSPTVTHVTFTPVTSGTVTGIPISKQGVFITLLGSVTTAQKIADPTLAQEGQVVTIQAGAATAFLLNAVDAAGVASEVSFSGDQDIATFGGAIGDGFSFKANNLAWMVLWKTNVTLTDT